VLDWVSSEGFETFFERFSSDGFVYNSAHEYRNRHLIRLFKENG